MSDELKRIKQELEQTKTELKKSQTELREFKLWGPAKEKALAAGLDPKDWELARLDLAETKRLDLNVLGEPMIVENGKESRQSLDEFFRTTYRKERPVLYEQQAPKQKAANGRKVIKRADFDRMSHTERSSYVRSGGTLVD